MEHECEIRTDFVHQCLALRVTSSHGTDTLPGRMSRLCAMNAATRARNLTVGVSVRTACDAYADFVHRYLDSYSRWHKDPTKSPLLDGSATSISGQGAKGCSNQTWTGIPSNDQPVIKIPHGQGGGCVTSGPFTNFTVNLGPLVPASKCVRPNPDPSGLGYNPRCLMRDINGFTGEGWLKDDDVVSLLQSDDYQTFWEVLQGGPMGNSFANGFMGVHTAGHFIIGGDPAGDFTASPGALLLLPPLVD